MGKLVDYRNAPAKGIAPGVKLAEITGADGKNMQADYLKLDAGGKYEGRVPAGSDQYFFVISGEATLAQTGQSGNAMSQGSFGIVQEGLGYVLTAKGACEALSVLAPPPGCPTRDPGFTGGLKVVSMHTEPIDEVPEKKKRRIYLVTKDAAGSERAHGMIVKYVPETETTLHNHPDCESLFVFLEGKTDLTIDGKKNVGTLGNAAFFPCGNIHALHGTPGGSHFIEFHIPYNYTTVR